jgi:hypothetical protein
MGGNGDHHHMVKNGVEEDFDAILDDEGAVDLLPHACR